MSYISSLGSTAIVNTRTGDDGVRIIQTQLQRIGFLGPGTGPSGVDGKWGPRTESAMQNAARYVGYTGTPFTVAGTQITVPDELMGLIQNAPPAQPGTPGTVAPGGGGGAASIIDTSTSTTDTSMISTTTATGFPWKPVLIVGGALAAVGVVAYMMKNRKYPTTVQAKGPAMRGPRLRARMRHAARRARKVIRIY